MSFSRLQETFVDDQMQMPMQMPMQMQGQGKGQGRSCEAANEARMVHLAEKLAQVSVSWIGG
jgi:hypothetical protein